VLELCVATEAVHYELDRGPITFGKRGPELGEPQVLADGPGNGLVASVEPERAGQAAAAGVKHLDLVTERSKNSLVGVGTYHRALVAVRMDHGAARASTRR